MEGILNSIRGRGDDEAEDAAVDVVEGLRERLRALEEIVVWGRRDHGFGRRGSSALEWLDPPFAVGHWVPEQVRLAGGWEVLGDEGGRPDRDHLGGRRRGRPGGPRPHARRVPGSRDDRRRVGADAAARTGWPRCGRSGRPGVRRRRLGAFARPGPRVIDGIEVLAELFDPAAFDGMAPPDTLGPHRLTR